MTCNLTGQVCCTEWQESGSAVHQLDQSKGQECRRPRHTWPAQGVGSVCACLTRPLQKRRQRHARNRHRQRMTSAAPPRQMKVGGDIKVSAPCTLGRKERSMAGKHAVQVSQATCLRVNRQVEMAWKVAWQAPPKSSTWQGCRLHGRSSIWLPARWQEERALRRCTL